MWTIDSNNADVCEAFFELTSRWKASRLMTFLKGNEVFGLDPLLIVLKANATPAVTSIATPDPLATSSSVILLLEMFVKSRISPRTLLQKKTIVSLHFRNSISVKSWSTYLSNSNSSIRRLADAGELWQLLSNVQIKLCRKIKGPALGKALSSRKPEKFN